MKKKHFVPFSSFAVDRKNMEASVYSTRIPDIHIAMARAQQHMRLVSVDGRDGLLLFAAHQG
jgi:hypothetical protein